jgi:TorA maturation chaperone TorD
MTLMTAQQDDAISLQTTGQSTESVITLQDQRAVNTPEQQYRAGAYSLLAALLRNVPTQEVLDRTAGLSDIDKRTDELATSMAMLGLSAKHSDPAAVDDEYHTLFIGLGRGEIVPYGSWYLTGFLMEKPLGELRTDLEALGFERDPAVKEPEDHVAALCEVMALLIQDGSSVSTQSQFFLKHMTKWLDRFFEDLTHADSASFYQAVARFGAAFVAFERQYFGLEIQEND